MGGLIRFVDWWIQRLDQISRARFRRARPSQYGRRERGAISISLDGATVLIPQFRVSNVTPSLEP